MQLYFEPVTGQNRSAVEMLGVAKGQEGYVESVCECLAEADGRRSWRPVALRDGKLLVGFAMYGYFWEYFPFGRVWLDRLLIDARYQGKGYGKKALKGLLRRIFREYPHQKRVYLSVYRENEPAIALYERAGFRFTGEKDVHGEDVMVLCRNTAERRRHGRRQKS